MPETCGHDSADGVDQNSGPDKVWRCLVCGLLYRSLEDEQGISHVIPLSAAEASLVRLDGDWGLSAPTVLEPDADLVMVVDTHNTAHVLLPKEERTVRARTLCLQPLAGMATLYDLLDSLAAPWSLLTNRQYRAWPPWPCQTCVSRAQGGEGSDREESD